MEHNNKLEVLLKNLANVEDKLSAMTDILIYLRSLQSNELDKLNSTEISFDTLFEYLTDGELCKATCKVLDTLLASVRPDLGFKMYQQNLLDGLRHPSSSVRQLCCYQMDRMCEKNHVALITNEPEFVELVIDCVCDESDVSGPLCKMATSVLCKISMDQSGMECLFSVSSSVLKYLKNSLTRHSSTVWFRLMQMVVKCCSENAESMKMCQTNLLLHMLIDKVRDDSDALSRSVAIETLTSLACSEHGYRWLVTQDVLPDLVNVLNDKDDPFAALIHPVILKFFAKLTTVFPERVFEDNLEYLTKVCNMIVDDGTSGNLLVNAIDALTGIASTVQGKLILHKLGPTFTNAVRRIGHIARHSTQETQLVCLHCIGAFASLLYIEGLDTEISKDGLKSICQTWFGELDMQPLQFLLKVSKNPILDGRLAVHKIYTGLANQEWAQKMMRDHPTFCEYVLDRSTEKEAEGIMLKYIFIQAMLNSPTLAKVFPASYIMKLKVYEEQGPLYVQAVSQVATEEGQ